MHLLYLDESGSVANSAEDFFVLAGVSVFERKAHFLEDELNAIAVRFDLFLKRCYARHGDPQRGLILLDKSSTEQRIQSLARDFKHYGHAWGKTYNYAEVPVFLDSRASRLIQLADLVAHALYRHHERGDSALFNRISHCFDSQGPTRHGYYVRD
ncbi:DUF3800 domain-containing protein [Thioalkalivibrio sp. ALgr3]|uniref:DUF3800 domain-containing protein n=1 Tax=Thioalkalivibrio sp. ALgr3 TaxID=1239292 RepID=UPI000372FB01|nr:DUF3800 domain-containing protein [Thioalkalivibrio sp. ALgr3]